MKKLTLVLSVTMLAFVAMSSVAEKALASHFASSELMDSDCEDLPPDNPNPAMPPQLKGDCLAVTGDNALDAHAKMVFRESIFFNKLRVAAIATGLDPDGVYQTLLYSSPDCSGGNFDVSTGMGEFHLGTFPAQWRVRSESFATLFSKIGGSDLNFDLDEVGSASIRDFQLFDPPLHPPVLIACGCVNDGCD